MPENNTAPIFITVSLARSRVDYKKKFVSKQTAEFTKKNFIIYIPLFDLMQNL